MKNKEKIAFAAINPVLVDNIVSPTEKASKANKWVIWGDGNAYPNYLYSLYQDVPTLHSLVDGLVDYILGDGVTSNVAQMTDYQAKKLARSVARSIVIYGGAAVNVLRSKRGQVAKACPLDMRCVRSTKDGSLVFYSEYFRDKKTYLTKYETLEFLPFDKESDAATSILLYKNTEFQTYPSPMYGGAVIACELERKINEYFINAINNNFSANVIINLNNGQPTSEQQEEIERNFSEKFAGVENAGAFVLSFNDDQEHSTTIEQIKQDDWSERFKSLRDRARQEIYTAFRANPNLFGVATENLGFSTEEYESSFKLFTRTVVLPLQQQVCEVIDAIFGYGSITISPFTIDFDGNKQDVEEVENNEVKVEDNE